MSERVAEIRREVTVTHEGSLPQGGLHRYRRTYSTPRHVHADHVWPDGVTTAATFTRAEWAALEVPR